MLFTFAKLFNQVSRRDDNARLGIGKKYLSANERVNDHK